MKAMLSSFILPPSSLNYALPHGRATAMLFLREIFQQTQARRLTLLRVELNAADVAVGDHRRVAPAVIGLAEHDAGVVRFAEIRMHEVEERPVFNAFRKVVRLPPLAFLPTDL